MSDIDAIPAIRIHGIREARTALRAASSLRRPVVLASAPSAGCHGGGAWFRALIARATAEFPETDATAVLDCGDQPGAALAALRAGVADMALDGSPDLLARVGAIALAVGARLHPPVENALDLRGCIDVDSACREWLMGTPENHPPGVAKPCVPGY
ncbi:MAG TPA: hypothetical protein VK943_14440 [Arenibaculum sp.]|nr:hypothetical protein [Arenibaculum sp.]